MEKVRLGDIATLINGDRGKNYPSQADITDEGDIPFVNAGHLNGRNIDFEEMNYISQDKYKRLSSGKFVKGDVLYCLRGSLGKKAIVNDDVEGAIASSLVIIRPNYDRIDGDYLMFSLDSPSIKEQLNKANNGSSQPNLSAASVREYQIELPDLKKQKDIVKKLVKTRSIIDSRQHEIDLLDELIKARFVELSNIWNASELPLSDFLDDITYGFTKPMPDSDVGPWKITAKDVVNGHINFETARKTTQEAYDLLTAKSKPIIGDVLLTKDGTLGRTAIVEDEKICVNQSVAVLRCNNKVLPRFLTLLLQLPEYQVEMTKNSGGGTIKHIYITKVDKMLVKIPDINSQKELISFVEQVDKSKVVIQKSLDETQLLFDSLMQKYFG